MADYDIFSTEQLEGFVDLYRRTGEDAKLEPIARALEARTGQRFGVQTPELANSGRLYAHKGTRDDSGRVTTTYTGDPAAFLAPFIPSRPVARIPIAALNATVRDFDDQRKANETARIMEAGRTALSGRK